MASVTDYYLVYRFVKALVTPFKKTKAYKLGIIDEKGNILKKMKDLETPAEKQAYGRFERMIWNLKKVLHKVPFLSKNFVSIAAASLLLFKEEKDYETTYAKYLVEDIEFLNEKISVVSVKKIEKYIGDLFSALNIDFEYCNNFFAEVNTKRNDDSVTNSELIRLFNTRFNAVLKTFNGDVQKVVEEMSVDINVPFILVWNQESEELNLMAKTITKKRGFKAFSQKLTVEDMPATNASSGNFAGLPPDDPPVSKSAQKKHKSCNKKKRKRKKFSDYVPREILNVK